MWVPGQMHCDLCAGVLSGDWFFNYSAYFVEIYIHRIHVYKKMACVELQDGMAKIKEQKL